MVNSISYIYCDMKYIITESQYQKTFNKFISYVFENHEEIKIRDEHPVSTFWVKNKKIIAEIHNLNYFVVAEDKWDSIEKFTSSSGKGVQSLIENWLETEYGLNSLEAIVVPNFRKIQWSSIEEKYL